MSTIIRFVPVAHATKRTTAIAMENDGLIRTRVENPVGAATDRRFNFSSLSEGQARVITEDPVTLVTSEKIGADARFVIDVTNYYDSALTGDDAPTERFLWYAYTVDEKDAPADNAVQTATPANPLYFVWTSGGTPASPTVAFNFPSQDQTAQRLYVELGTTEERRNYLKARLLEKVNDPLNIFIFAGTSIAVQNAASIRVNNNVAIVQREHSRRMQGWVYRIEMLVRAVSADVNLNTEAKFNLLAGEIGISNADVFQKMDLAVNGAIAVGAARTDWVFQRLGSVAASSPYAYSPPSHPTLWSATHETTIDVGAAPPSGVTDWYNWLRT